MPSPLWTVARVERGSDGRRLIPVAHFATRAQACADAARRDVVSRFRHAYGRRPNPRRTHHAVREWWSPSEEDMDAARQRLV